jgi:hypothetical protein
MFICIMNWKLYGRKRSWSNLSHITISSTWTHAKTARAQVIFWMDFVSKTETLCLESNTTHLFMVQLFKKSEKRSCLVGSDWWTIKFLTRYGRNKRDITIACGVCAAFICIAKQWFTYSLLCSQDIMLQARELTSFHMFNRCWNDRTLATSMRSVTTSAQVIRMLSLRLMLPSSIKLMRTVHCLMHEQRLPEIKSNLCH